MFVKPIFYSDQQYNHDDIYGYLSNAGGIVVGVDSQTIGGGIGYWHIKQKDINNTVWLIDINNYEAFLYGMQSIHGSTYFKWNLSAGFNDYNSNKSVNYSGQQFIAKGIIGKLYYTNSLTFDSEINASTVYLHTSAPQSWQYSSNNAGITTIGGGLKISARESRGKYNILPEIRMLAFYDVFNADINAITAVLIGGPVISTSGQPARTSGQIGASLSSRYYRNSNISLNYDLLLKSNYFNNVVSLNWRYLF